MHIISLKTTQEILLATSVRSKGNSVSLNYGGWTETSFPQELMKPVSLYQMNHFPCPWQKKQMTISGVYKLPKCMLAPRLPKFPSVCYTFQSPYWLLSSS